MLACKLQVTTSYKLQRCWPASYKLQVKSYKLHSASARHAPSSGFWSLLKLHSTRKLATRKPATCKPATCNGRMPGVMVHFSAVRTGAWSRRALLRSHGWWHPQAGYKLQSYKATKLQSYKVTKLQADRRPPRAGPKVSDRGRGAEISPRSPPRYRRDSAEIAPRSQLRACEAASDTLQAEALL